MNVLLEIAEGLETDKKKISDLMSDIIEAAQARGLSPAMASYACMHVGAALCMTMHVSVGDIGKIAAQATANCKRHYDDLEERGEIDRIVEQHKAEKKGKLN